MLRRLSILSIVLLVAFWPSATLTARQNFTEFATKAFQK
jgi:hypothetical protein